MPIGIQLGHAGRKASSSRPWDGGGALPATDPRAWTTLAPSAIPFHPTDPTPQALDAAGIDAIVDAFVAAAQRAERIGLDLIELHAAHGYLLHQFLSPLSNKRDDEYGGSLQNRMRLLVRGRSRRCHSCSVRRRRTWRAPACRARPRPCASIAACCSGIPRTAATCAGASCAMGCVLMRT